MNPQEIKKQLVENFKSLSIHAATLHLKRNNPEFRMDLKSAESCADAAYSLLSKEISEKDEEIAKYAREFDIMIGNDNRQEEIIEKQRQEIIQLTQALADYHKSQKEETGDKLVHNETIDGPELRFHDEATVATLRSSSPNSIEQKCAHEWVSYKRCSYCGAYQNDNGTIIEKRTQENVEEMRELFIKWFAGSNPLPGQTIVWAFSHSMTLRPRIITMRKERLCAYST